ncbi:glutaredoxin domain-containing protein [Eremococcus coleocola]|uniref:Glutaredoxin n=1 Tax=Eremococcus coleocola ACS-139-V-Col8 TaxID=908337 RepID=E4KQJ8_9LACT|nr:glutaredoxin domain-containing protein [Eremococcus coleocola]EFR30614.1 glutaredoxin [Eremococcus coleocola ACS-139-V-Col8]
MSVVIIYSKPDCSQCNFSKEYLKILNIPYQEVDVYSNEAALKYVTEELGFRSLPVITAEGHEPFNGFRPDLLKKLGD